MAVTWKTITVFLNVQSIYIGRSQESYSVFQDLNYFLILNTLLVLLWDIFCHLIFPYCCTLLMEMGLWWHDGRDVRFKHPVLIIQSTLEVIQTFVCIGLVEIIMFTMFSRNGVLNLPNLIWLKFSVHIGFPSMAHFRMVFDRRVQYMIYRKYQKINTETHVRNKIHHTDSIILLAVL